MDSTFLLETLKKHVETTMGCTDPAAVAYATARSCALLEGSPELVEVTVSPSIFKNGLSVFVPGTGRRGLAQAAALGAGLSAHVHEGLNIIDRAGARELEWARTCLEEGRVTVRYDAGVPDPLYIKVETKSRRESAWTVIRKEYTNIAEEGKNGKVIFLADPETVGSTEKVLAECSIREIVEAALRIPLPELAFLLEAAMMNKRAALVGLSNEGTGLGRGSSMDEEASFPQSAINLSKQYTAAAAEARMLGLKVPVTAIAGSGNHGITNFLGVLAVAECLEASQDALTLALAISSSITLYIKGFLHEVSALCGCTVAAAIGVAAATVHLLDGTFEDMANAMQSVIGVLAGIFCDGAKESCAYKLSTATATAVEYAYLAKVKGVYIHGSQGIVSSSIEETIAKLAILNDCAMLETEKCMLEIIEDIQSSADTRIDGGP